MFSIPFSRFLFSLILLVGFYMFLEQITIDWDSHYFVYYFQNPWYIIHIWVTANGMDALIYE